MKAALLIILITLSGCLAVLMPDKYVRNDRGVDAFHWNLPQP